MRRVHEEILRLLDGRAPFAVATVVEASGSTPGKPGFKLVVREDGTATGTVGGAGLEEHAKKLALAALESGRGGLFSLPLARGAPGGLDSLCGGTVQLAIEVLVPPPHLLVAGGGHIGKSLHDMAHVLGWRVSILDDRPDYVAEGRFPHAVRRIQAGPEHLRDADLDGYSHLVLVGYSHAMDTQMLKHALARFPGSIGVVGSQAKRAGMERALRQAGLREGAMERVECPMGLAIGAESPAEIALAVIAGILRQERLGARAAATRSPSLAPDCAAAPSAGLCSVPPRASPSASDSGGESR